MLIHFEMPTEFEAAHKTKHVRRVSDRFPVDVIETEKATLVYAELPGVKKADMNITLEEGVLSISGKRGEKEIPEDARVLLHEQRIRDFSRSIRIGHPVELDTVTASLENGLLAVELPKAAIARPRTINIA